MLVGLTIEEINSNSALLHGLEVATKEYLNECNRLDEDMEL